MSTYNLGQDLTGEVKKRTSMGIFLGVVMVVLGFLLMVFPLATATVTTIFIGCILIIAGVIDIVLALRSHTVGTFFLRLLLGIVYAVAGVLLIASPLWGVAVLTLVLGWMLIFEAIFAVVLAFQMRPANGWAWFLFDAVITGFLGVLVLAHWPASAIWAIGTLVGAAVLVRGITRIAVSIGMKKLAGRVEDITRPRAA
jgi:uncharacterized membrane protein HdeD (DUF308 family)